MICARYFYNIFRRVHTMQYHLKTPYEWFNLHNFPSETPPQSWPREAEGMSCHHTSTNSSVTNYAKT